jgi:hypothetical protein
MSISHGSYRSVNIGRRGGPYGVRLYSLIRRRLGLHAVDREAGGGDHDAFEIGAAPVNVYSNRMMSTCYSGGGLIVLFGYEVTQMRKTPF